MIQDKIVGWRKNAITKQEIQDKEKVRRIIKKMKVYFNLIFRVKYFTLKIKTTYI